MSSVNDQRAPNRPRPTPPATRPGHGRNRKLTNGLVALSTAAVMAIYGVGYAHTAPAANSMNTDAAPLAAIVATATTPTESPATATTLPATSTATATATASSAATARSSASSSPTPITASTATSTRVPTATATPAAATSAGTYLDGTYTGTGTSRHGSIGVTVIIQGGTIVSTEITTCGTRYPCSKIAALPGQVLDRQSANVDFVSGSTDSSRAFKAAVQAALAKAA